MIERSWGAVLLDDLESYQEAIAFVTNHLLHHPNNHHALNNRALLFWEIDSIEEASRDFDAAVSVGGTEPRIFRNRGLFRQKRGDLESAIADFRTATTLAPHEAAFWRCLGFAQEKAGQLPEALKALDRAIALEPQVAHTVQYRDTLARSAGLPARPAGSPARPAGSPARPAGSPATTLLSRLRSWWLRRHPSANSAIQWVDPSTLRPGPIQHDTLSTEQLRYVQFIHDCLEAVDGLTFDARVDLFRRDLHIDQEIHITAAIANGLRFFATKHENLSPGYLKEVYRVLLLRSMATPDEVLARANVEHLTRSDVHELMELLEGNMSRSVRELIMAGA